MVTPTCLENQRITVSSDRTFGKPKTHKKSWKYNVTRPYKKKTNPVRQWGMASALVTVCIVPVGLTLVIAGMKLGLVTPQQLFGIDKITVQPDAKLTLDLSQIPQAFEATEAPKFVLRDLDVKNEESARLSDPVKQQIQDIKAKLSEEEAHNQTPPPPLFKENEVHLMNDKNERKRRQIMSIDIDKAFPGVIDNGIVEAFGKAAQLKDNGSTTATLLAAAAIETRLGTAASTQDDLLQVKDATFFEYFTKYGQEFVDLIQEQEPQLAKQMGRMLPFLRFNAEKRSFVFDDRGYLARYKNYPVIGKQKTRSLKEAFLEYRKDPFVVAGLTDLRLDHEGRSVEKQLRATKGEAAVAFLNELGPSSAYLVHFLGPTGLRRAIEQRKAPAMKAIPALHNNGVIGSPERKRAEEVLITLAGRTDVITDRINWHLEAHGYGYDLEKASVAPSARPAGHTQLAMVKAIAAKYRIDL